MQDRTKLLEQLRIDRPSAPSSNPFAWKKAAAIVGALLMLVLLTVWLWPVKVKVDSAVARAVGGGHGGTDGVQLDASGYVVARRQATVSSKITAKVTDVLIEEGQHVQQGAVIGRLDDSNVRAALAEAQAQYEYSKATLAQVRVNLANAERDLKRKKALFAGHFVSQADLDTSGTTQEGLSAELNTTLRSVEVAAKALELARRNLDDTLIRAPFAGVVTVKAAQPGEMVSPVSAGGGFTRTGIGTIVDMDSLEVEVDVNENFISRVHAGQPATIKLNAYPDWQIPAYVIAIIPTADRSKATVKVRIGFRAKDSRVLPDMGARVAFLDDARPDRAPDRAVLVPVSALESSSGASNVFVIHGNKVELRRVIAGARSGADQRIESGLAAGERVAVSDLAQLTDGMTVDTAH